MDKIRCANPACGVLFEPPNRYTRCCGRTCGYKYRELQWMEKKEKEERANTQAPAYIHPGDSTNQPELMVRVRDLLRTRPRTVEELADALERPPKSIREAVAALQEDAHNVRLEGDRYVLTGDLVQGGTALVDMSAFVGVWRKFGAIGDTHLGNKHARLDVLNALYARFVEEGVAEVFHTGNMIEGEARFSRLDLEIYGLDKQVNYWIQNYPQRPGIVTRFVAGDDHEGWYAQREGIDIGRHMELAARAAGRDDLQYLGYMECDVELKAPAGRAIMRVLHQGGGSAYAISYTDQKRVESYQGGEKPQIELAGHYHKASYSYPREVHCIQTGCVCDQTTFMRKKRLAAHLGGWIIWVMQGEDGSIQRFRAEWMPFYDRGYYANWKVA